LPIKDWSLEEGIGEQEIRDRLHHAVAAHTKVKEQAFNPVLMRMAEKSILLRVLDQSWKDHLLMLDHLRQGIGLRGYAQRDPLNEFKREAFQLFHEMLHRVRETTVMLLSHIDIGEGTPEEVEEAAFHDATPRNMSYSGPVETEDGDFVLPALPSIKERLARSPKKKTGGKPKK